MNDTKRDQKPQNPRDSDSSSIETEQRALARQLAEYLQRKTKLQMSGVEVGLNSHQYSQRMVLLTTILKMIGICVDDVISWAKAIPGVTNFHPRQIVHECDSYGVLNLFSE